MNFRQRAPLLPRFKLTQLRLQFPLKSFLKTIEFRQTPPTSQPLSRPSGCGRPQPESRVVRSVRFAGTEESAFVFVS